MYVLKNRDYFDRSDQTAGGRGVTRNAEDAPPTFIYLSLFLAFASSARAEVYWVRTESYGNEYSPLRIVEKKECLALTGSIATPERAIEESLEKLNEINQGNPKMATCLDYAANQRRDKKYSESNYAIENNAAAFRFNENFGWHFQAKLGFTEAELEALNAYIGSFYRVINSDIRENNPEDPDTEIELAQELINAALDRLPSYRDGPLLRFADLPLSTLKEHELGAIVTYPSFTSTSKRANWQWRGLHSFTIFSGKNGRDVTALNAGEEEVLFKSGTRFKVLAREEKLEGKIHFVLAEVDEAGNVIGADQLNPAVNAP